MDEKLQDCLKQSKRKYRAPWKRVYNNSWDQIFQTWKTSSHSFDEKL